MKKQYKNLSLWAATALLLFTACDPEIDRPAPNYETARGNADFSVYVALGNSLTAGYADGALNRQGQIWSYPAIIADKLQYIYPNLEFNQPLLPEGRANGTRYITSFSNGLPNIVAEQAGLTQQQIFAPVQGNFQNLGVPGARVGHLTFAGYGSQQGNPYFARFATTPTTTMVDMAVAQNPTFFTLWIGNNDVLGYALAGGVNETITSPEAFRVSYQAIINQLVASNASIEGALANIPDVSRIPYVSYIRYNQLVLTEEQAGAANAAYRANIVDAEGGLGAQVKTAVITTVVITTGVATQAVFTLAFNEAKAAGASDAEAQQIANNFVQSGAGQGQIAGLRDILLEDEVPAPYTDLKNTINFLIENPSQRPAQITQEINTLMAAPQLPAELQEAINAQIENQIMILRNAGFYPYFQSGANPFVIEDKNPANPLGIRPMRAGERILLSALGDGLLTPETAALPKPDQYILDEEELADINEAITAYNAIISDIAQTNTFALVDMNGFFNQVATNGLVMDGTSFSAAFVTGNAFSLDGVHLTPKGYALVARRFIESINSYYNSQIPTPNLAAYPAVAFPN